VKVNLSIDPRIREWGEQLAKIDHRDLSNEVEWLIETEFNRRSALAQMELNGLAANGHGHNGKDQAA